MFAATRNPSDCKGLRLLGAQKSGTMSAMYAGWSAGARAFYAWACLPRDRRGWPPRAKNLERDHGLYNGLLAKFFEGRSVRVGTLRRIADALNCPVQWITDGQQRPNPTTDVAERSAKVCSSDDLLREILPKAIAPCLEPLNKSARELQGDIATAIVIHRLHPAVAAVVRDSETIVKILQADLAPTKMRDKLVDEVVDIVHGAKSAGMLTDVKPAEELSRAWTRYPSKAAVIAMAKAKGFDEAAIAALDSEVLKAANDPGAEYWRGRLKFYIKESRAMDADMAEIDPIFDEVTDV